MWKNLEWKHLRDKVKCMKIMMSRKYRIYQEVTKIE